MNILDTTGDISLIQLNCCFRPNGQMYLRYSNGKPSGSIEDRLTPADLMPVYRSVISSTRTENEHVTPAQTETKTERQQSTATTTAPANRGHWFW